MKEEPFIYEVGSVLKKAGYRVSEFISRRSCFDIAAIKKGKPILIKIVKDLGKIQRSYSSDLQVVSEVFSATPLFIGVKSGEKPLKDDTLYERYNIRALTLRTLEYVVSEGTNPLVIAGPGGYYVNVDGEAIKRRRHELGLSIGKLAEMVGVSRGTIYSYEKGSVKATVSIAYKLEETLGFPIIKPIDSLRWPLERSIRRDSLRSMIQRKAYLKRIYKIMARLECKIEPIRRAPFDFIVKHSKNQMLLIGCFSKIEGRENRRVNEILSFGEIVNSRSLIITKGRCKWEVDAPKISIRDLELIDDLEKLLSEY